MWKEEEIKVKSINAEGSFAVPGISMVTGTDIE